MVLNHIPANLLQIISSDEGETNIVYNDDNATYGNRPTITLTTQDWYDGIQYGDVLIVRNPGGDNNGYKTIYARETSKIISLDDVIAGDSLADETDSTPNSVLEVRRDSDRRLNRHIISSTYNLFGKKLFYNQIVSQPGLGLGQDVGGESYGYAAGGSPATMDNRIDRWPFASGTTNAVDTTANLPANRDYNRGCASATYGYSIGGALIPFPGAHQDDIARWPFASSTTNASNIGTLSSNIAACAGISAVGEGYGYRAGGDLAPPINIPATPLVNVIERWPFATGSPTNATDVGDMTASKHFVEGVQSETYGYVCGGTTTPAYQNVIERWPFASATTNASDVGDLLRGTAVHAAASGTILGYIHGGASPPTSRLNDINSWPFATGTTNASDVGNLTQSINSNAGSSSKTYGYCMGGSIPPGGADDTIERWPFSTSTTNSSDVGNLSGINNNLAGNIFF